MPFPAKTKRNHQVVLDRDKGMTFTAIGKKHKIARNTAYEVYIRELRRRVINSESS